MQRKSILITLACLAITAISFSQDALYGIRGGLNISNLDFKPDATFRNQHRNGFAFGAFVDYGITEKFAAYLEIQYSAEGAKGDDLRADYLQMPIMGRFAIGEKFLVGVGPMVSLKTWQEEDAFSTVAFSGIAGVEYMITGELFVDARIHYGLTNIIDEDISGLEAQNTTFQFGIGVKL